MSYLGCDAACLVVSGSVVLFVEELECQGWTPFASAFVGKIGLGTLGNPVLFCAGACTSRVDEPSLCAPAATTVISGSSNA